MKKKGRLLPKWIPNIILFSVFFLLSIYFSCKIISTGYKMTKLNGSYKTLKSWNQYYKALVLKEFSPVNIKSKIQDMNLALLVPEKWRIKDVEISEVPAGKNNDKAEAATK